MKRTLTLALVACSAMALTGCMSDSQSKDVADSYKEFVHQERTYTAVELAGTNMEIHITGVTRMALEAPLNPLSVVPSNPDTAREIVDGVVKVGAIAATYYGIKELADSKGNSTVNNNNAAATP